jgi:hypothetical protein
MRHGLKKSMQQALQANAPARLLFPTALFSFSGLLLILSSNMAVKY